ncbi:MAG TPA: HRDC domain-containing protein [Acidimicrobiales bacterium]|nr:HRDC domain-containing protein [Acidimicrobiales bacterium]
MSAGTRHDYVDDDAGFAEVVDALRVADAYALDTEFHRERTYYPRIALVQLAWDDEVVVVDPLAVDLRPLAEILEGPATAVLHAAGQDLEVLLRACGTVPRTLFDTQVAAGFVGMSAPSLAALVEREIGVRLPKGDRLTDWLQRPLTPQQLSYAASDVVHLLDVWRNLTDQLAARGRLEWARTECEELRSRARTHRVPDEAWMRIKEARHLRGGARDVARAIAAWRERRAMDTDQPVRFVLPDLAVVAIAQRQPTTPEELRSIRGVDERHARGEIGRSLLAAVAEGRANPVERTEAPPAAELARELRPAVSLVSSWVSQLARDEQLDTTLLATRADLEALLRGDPDARLAHGWRGALVGEPIRALIEGRAALAFDGKGGLCLEERTCVSFRADPASADQPPGG